MTEDEALMTPPDPALLSELGKLKAAGAISPETAVWPGSLVAQDHFQRVRAISQGYVAETIGRRYYLTAQGLEVVSFGKDSSNV